MTNLVLLENGNSYFYFKSEEKNSRCLSLICFRRKDYLLSENDDTTA